MRRILALVTVYTAVGACGDVLLQTQCGAVLGLHNETTGVARFLGIPYAQAPVGGLRFRNPVLLEGAACWSPAVWNGTAFGSDCVQSGQFNEGGSEDCLFVNVWIPKNQAEPMPIMVYSYGGDLTDGKSSSYDFEWLSQNSGHVVVSMNYRVNLFGFLALKELSETAQSGVSGNFGFHDQLAALQWVQANAQAMKGDSTRVTFFGQSSGGTSVYALLASKKARGLFTRAVSLSGSANLTMDLASAERQNMPILSALGCNPGQGGSAATVQCLQNLSTEAVQSAIPASWNTVKALWSLPPASAASQGMQYQGIAIVDGVLVEQPLQAALRAGSNPVPLIISSLAQETDAQPGRVVSADSAAAFAAILDTTFAPWGQGSGGKVLDQYASEATGGLWQRVYDSIMADYGQTCASIPTALAASQGGALGSANHPVYELYISATPSHPVWGFDATYQPRYAFHSLDILAGLGHWDLWSASRGLPAFQPRATDVALRASLLAVLTNFTRDGRLDESTGWVSFAAGCTLEDGDACYTVVNVTNGGVPVPSPRLRQDVCDFWTELGFDQRFWWSN